MKRNQEPGGLKPVVTLNMRFGAPVYEDVYRFVEEAAKEEHVVVTTEEVLEGTVRRVVLMKARGHPIAVERFRFRLEAAVAERNHEDRNRGRLAH